MLFFEPMEPTSKEVLVDRALVGVFRSFRRI